MTKVWGSHASKAGFYFQHSFKPQSIFASFNSQIDFIDNASNPLDTGYSYANAAIGVFNTYTQASKYALPEWRYKNWEFYAQDNWKPTSRLTLDYGVRFYYLTPQWDTTLQASNFIPEQFSAASAAKLFTPVCIGASPCSGTTNRRGMDPTLIAAGVTPTMANTVEERFIGRLTPGSNRFNGAFQAGQGINDQLQDGNAFRISPRLGVVYDLTGKGVTIVRGGFGIFYDRPQGNQVFDMISNAPGVLNESVQFGRLQTLTSGGGDPNPTLSLNPSAFDFKPPRVNQWNVGIQHKVWREVILDVAYVGSKSTDLLRQVQINALPFGATLAPQNQDPTRAPAAQLGSSALPNDFLRPFKGYGGIRMWDYSGYANYHALQTSVTRRFDAGFMFSGFYVWSKALGINSTDFSAGVPNLSDEQTKRLDYSYLDYDRPHNFVVNFIYQTPTVTSSKALGVLANEWQISGVYRWTSGRPYGVGFSIPSIGAANLTGTDGNPNARIVHDVRPGSRVERRSVQTTRHLVLRSAAARQRRCRVSAVLRARAAHQQPRSVARQERRRGKGGQVRGAARRVQRPEPHAVHGRQCDRQLRELDGSNDHQPALRCEWSLGAAERVRGDQRRGSTTHASTRHTRDLLDYPLPDRREWGRRHMAPALSFVFAAKWNRDC